jgi:hypothetical protein
MNEKKCIKKFLIFYIKKIECLKDIDILRIEGSEESKEGFLENTYKRINKILYSNDGHNGYICRYYSRL